MSRWFRHYAGLARDEKLVGVAMRTGQPVERVAWVWCAILESAAEIDDGGRYEFDCAGAAWFLRAAEADMAAVEAGLAAAGRVAEGRVVKWGDRQYQSDRSAVRQAEYRKRKRAGGDGDDSAAITSGNVTPSVSDGGVTSPDRDVTPPDTDTDTDTHSSECVTRARDPVAGGFDETERLSLLETPNLDGWERQFLASLPVGPMSKAQTRKLDAIRAKAAPRATGPPPPMQSEFNIAAPPGRLHTSRSFTGILRHKR